jgi:hypothetical protein
MKRKKVWIIAVISLLLLIALGIFWPEGLAGLFIILFALVLSFLSVFLPKMILMSSSPDLSGQEIERILLQDDFGFSSTGDLFPTYPGPSGFLLGKEPIFLKEEKKQ